MISRSVLALLLPLVSCVYSEVRPDAPVTTQGETSPFLDGRPIVLTENGAWCWYQDERAIVDVDHPTGPMLLASSVAFGPKGGPDTGDCNVHWFHIRTGAQGTFELHDQLEADDHDNAALHIRPDGRYLAVYTKHSTDKKLRWRISSRPHDPTDWQAESTLQTGARTCYSNVFALNGANGQTRLFDFIRGVGYDPNWFVSEDQGATWSYGGKLHTGPGGNEATSQRPYLKYAAHGTQALHFITTEGHPRNEDNSIYHGVLSRGRLTNSFGEDLGPLSQSPTSEVQSTDFTPVLTPGASLGGVEMRHAWTVDLQVDSSGHPYAAMSARAHGSKSDHRFLYARFDGKAWKTVELAKAGGYLYKAEGDYTGLVALHPNDPNTVFISTPIDPRTDTDLAHYEIFMGQTSDTGDTWTWSPITWNSDTDNLRPIVPIWDNQHTALLYLQGSIASYHSWDAKVILRMAPTRDLHRLRAPE